MRRRRIATALEDEQFADVLEELDEDEQIELVAGLDHDRVADLLEEMAPDDAADLLGEMDPQQRVALLDAMEPDEAAPVRRLLLYDSESAGGLMTPEPVIVTPDTTVAECLARLRNPDLPAAVAAHVFVVEPPNQTPTGRYLGTVGFQRLLREPPAMRVEGCVEENVEPIHPDLPATRVAERLAAYNLVALPVCDDAGRLVGAVTVDDVLDRVLPEGWRDDHLAGRVSASGTAPEATPVNRARRRRGDDLSAPAAGWPSGSSTTPRRSVSSRRRSPASSAPRGSSSRQTVLVIIWVTINVVAVSLQWDPYPFILLNLMFSVQAAYAAPLILLAQNRQAERDRVETDRDRQVNARVQADAEYLRPSISAMKSLPSTGPAGSIPSRASVPGSESH